jgi:hypothetical protein
MKAGCIWGKEVDGPRNVLVRARRQSPAERRQQTLSVKLATDLFLCSAKQRRNHLRCQSGKGAWAKNQIGLDLLAIRMQFGLRGVRKPAGVGNW